MAIIKVKCSQMVPWLGTVPANWRAANEPVVAGSSGISWERQCPASRGPNCSSNNGLSSEPMSAVLIKPLGTSLDGIQWALTGNGGRGEVAHCGQHVR